MKKFVVLFSLFAMVLCFTSDASAFFRRRVVQNNIAVNVGGFGAGVSVRNRTFVGGFRNRAFIGGGFRNRVFVGNSAFVGHGAFVTPFATSNQVIFGSPFISTTVVSPFVPVPTLIVP